MSDETAESSAATTTEAEATSAETENTSAEATEEENRVPQSRFSEVVRERNELREAKAALEAKLEVAKTPVTPPADETLDAQEAEAKRLIEKHASGMWKREMGMTMAETKARLEAADTASASSQQLQWESTCAKHGLDPADADIADAARGFAAGAKQRGETLDIDAVMAKVKKRFTTSETKKAGASVETDGVSETMQSTDWAPRDVADANAGTAKGKRSKFVSGADALKRAAAK